MSAKSFLAVAFMAGAAVGQTSTSAGISSIVTSSIAAEVSPGLRASWCNAQQNVCKLLCESQFRSNTCDPPTLTYNCICNNGTAPGLQYYKDTIDFNTCQQAFSDCILAHPNDQAGQDNCKVNIQDHCGTLDIANFTAAPASTSATPTNSVASSAGAAPTSTTASGSAATASPTGGMATVKEMSAGILGAGLLVVFGVLL